jgi:hypothetical protein
VSDTETIETPGPTPDPPFVVTKADKRRWELCQAIAWRTLGPDAAGVWMAARVLFQSRIPTT